MPNMINKFGMGQNAPWRQELQRQNGTFANFAGGEEAFKFIMDRLKNGLDPKQRAMIEGQAGGQIAGGTQAINEAFAGSGLSGGSKLGALTALRGNVGKNTQNALLQGDMSAKENALSALLQGAGLNSDIGLKSRMQGLQEKAYNDSQDFSWGDLFGGLFGTAGSIFGKFL